MRRILSLVMTLLTVLTASAGVTIEECVEKATANYPLIKKNRLIEATAEIDLSEINKVWLPHLNTYAQVTGQNTVPSYPAPLSNILSQMGQEVKGLGKIQYKVGVELSQPIWDGGVSAARREMVRTREEIERNSIETELYAVKERVESLFFALLLTEAQIAQSETNIGILRDNLSLLHSMFANGTAIRSDLDMVEARILTSEQGVTQARSAAQGYRTMLALFIGESPEGLSLILPSEQMPTDEECLRPELRLFELKNKADRATDRLNGARRLPTVGFFAQAYYGYPGFDYFQSMMKRSPSFNIMAGIKLNWSLDVLYNKKEQSRRLANNALDIATDRETFLFNVRLQTANENETIKGLRKVIADDEKIISLQSNVRKAAESQLRNGTIDTYTLLAKISEENMAQLNAKFHQIQLLSEIYKLKHTLNK